jgi:hypothetical protein
MAFLKAILTDEKKVLKAAQVTKINVPLYAELSVKEMYQEVLLDEDLRPFLPDLKVHTSKVPESDFFFGVVATIKGDFLRGVIEEANNQRFISANEEEE